MKRLTVAGAVVLVALAAVAGAHELFPNGSKRVAAGTVPSSAAPPPPTVTASTSRPTPSTRLPPPPRTTVPRSALPEIAPFRVERITLVYVDPSRATPARGLVAGHGGRTLRTIVRWPVTRTGALVPEREPLVVFAHGYAVQTATYAALLDDLAAAGAVVAAPELPGESSVFAGPPNENDLGNEPCDLVFVANALRRDPPRALASVLTGAPVVYAGHSDGATAAAAAGYSSERCAGPQPDAIVALSPDDVPVDRNGANPLPLLAATGTNDEVNPVSHTMRLWLHVPSPALLLTVQGGSHLGTFTTDPALSQVDAIISAFIRAHTVEPAAAARIVARGRLRLFAR